jgi:hypothetical protein
MTFFLNVPPQQIFTAGMAVGAVTTVRQLASGKPPHHARAVRLPAVRYLPSA